MSYKNPILRFASNHPVVAFFAVPIAMQVVAKGVFMGIRSVKTGSPLGAVLPSTGSDDQLRNLGAVRKQGGAADDLTFRATASNRPATGGSSEREWIQPRTETPPVRYDEAYRDEGFLTDPNYKENLPVVTQPSIFAGMNGIHKIR